MSHKWTCLREWLTWPPQSAKRTELALLCFQHHKWLNYNTEVQSCYYKYEKAVCGQMLSFDFFVSCRTFAWWLHINSYNRIKACCSTLSSVHISDQCFYLFFCFIPLVGCFKAMVLCYEADFILYILCSTWFFFLEPWLCNCSVVLFLFIIRCKALWVATCYRKMLYK